MKKTNLIIFGILTLIIVIGGFFLLESKGITTILTGEQRIVSLLSNEKHESEKISWDEKVRQRQPLGGNYFADDNDVYFSEKPLGEDPKQFKVLDEDKRCAKGQNFFYIDGERVFQFDASSLQLLGYGYSKDKDNVYKTCRKIDGADADTFRQTYEYSGEFVDKNFGYVSYGDREQIPLDDFWFLYHDKGGADLGNNYRKYKDKIYYWADGGGQAVPGMVSVNINPTTLRTFGTGSCRRGDDPFDPCDHYAKDDVKVYKFWSEIKGADPKTFKLLGNGNRVSYGKDKDSVFYDTMVMPEADAPTFNVLSDDYGLDNKKVFYLEYEIIGANPDTFRIFEADRQIGRDGDTFFWRDEKINPEEYERFGVSEYLRD